MEKQPFEKAWQDAFHGKEKQPPPHIWSALAAQLANAAAVRSRRKAIVFQWLAAASVVFGLSLLFWNRPQVNDVPPLATENAPQTPAAADLHATQRHITPADSIAYVLNRKIESAAPASEARNGAGNRKKNVSNERTNSTARRRNANFQQRAFAFLRQSKAQPLLTSPARVHGSLDAVAPVPSANEAGGVSEASSKTEDESTTGVTESVLATAPATVPSEEKKQTIRPLWTAVGFAGGGFNTTPAGGSSASLQATASADPAIATSQKEQVGTAFSFGIGVGKQISKRWALQTGLVYLQQSLTYTSTLVSLDAGNARAQVYLAEFSSASNYSTNVMLTSPYQLQASVNYLAVPVLAGYTVVDRTFAIHVNVGMATDFLVQSGWQDRSGQFNDNRQSVNEMYRTINWAGLFNTEFSYRLGKHYRASLVPGLRYSLQPVYRPEINNTMRPFIWDIGFRLKYQF